MSDQPTTLDYENPLRVRDERRGRWRSRLRAFPIPLLIALSIAVCYGAGVVMRGGELMIFPIYFLAPLYCAFRIARGKARVWAKVQMILAATAMTLIAPFVLLEYGYFDGPLFQEIEYGWDDLDVSDEGRLLVRVAVACLIWFATVQLVDWIVRFRGRAANA